MKVRGLFGEVLSPNLADSEATLSNGLPGEGRQPRCRSVACTSACPGLESSFWTCLVAQPFIHVANLWRLHSQSLATGTRRLYPMCDLSNFITELFRGEPRVEWARSIGLWCLASSLLT